MYQSVLTLFPLLFYSLFFTNIVIKARKGKHDSPYAVEIFKPLNSSKVSEQVVNGEPVKIESVPSAAIISILDAMCAGTVLNSWTVLSAAHCFEYSSDVGDISVNVGGTYISDYDSVMYDVLKIEMHPQYNVIYQFDSDIALVFVDGPIKFGKSVAKAILVYDKKWMHEKEKQFIVTGWGLMSEDGQVSDKGLLKAKLHFVPSDKCARFHNCNITATMFCLYGNAYQDTCKGDSGGGVMWNKFVVGIVSHGNGCARKDRPSVYTNVYVFREWIKSRVFAFIESYCKTDYS